MRRSLLSALAVAALLLLVACNGDDDDDATPTTTATSTPTATSTATPTATETPTPTPTEQPAVSDCEARGFGNLSVGDVVEEPFVCLRNPLPGQSVMGAIVVSGWSAGAFEANLVVDVLDGDGSILSRLPTTVAQPDIGLFAGEFAITMPMEDAPSAPSGTIHVWAESPRDGSIAFDTTIEVVFGPDPNVRLHPAGTRTGVAQVDQALALIDDYDSAGLAELFVGVEGPCDSQRPGGFIPCPPGADSGDIVSGFINSICDAGLAPLDSASTVGSTIVGDPTDPPIPLARVYAVVRVADAAAEYDAVFRILLGHPAGPFQLWLTEDGGVVKVDQPCDELDPAKIPLGAAPDFILAPPD